MKKPELLAPAGNMDSLKAAIAAGCDAIYLGGKMFGARTFAPNFSNKEMIEAIRYAHIYGVKVYVTVNTLIFENEIDDFLEYIDFLHKNHVDAIIIQDLGMLDLVSQTYPNLEIHASTQMNIHNKEGVELVKKLGVKRVVLAREMTIDEVQEIKKEVPMELEVFVHGALCISYSGQCLMSYFQGGRSGNRGNCAQCCRMPYNLVHQGKIINSEKYLLSTKDLCTIHDIGKLIEIGVDSFKIEGRMKRPEYVYMVTKLYRQAIDQYMEKRQVHISKFDFQKLQLIFNREFTKGFLMHEKNCHFTNPYRPNHMGIEIGKIIKVQNNFVTIELKRDIVQEDGIRILDKKQDVGCILNKIYHQKKLVNHAKKGDHISIYLEKPVQVGDIVIKTTDKKIMDEIKKELSNQHRKVDISMQLNGICSKNLKIIISDFTHTITVESDYICTKAKTHPITEERIKKQLSRIHDTAYQIKKLEINIDPDIFIDIQALNQLRRDAISQLNQARCYQIPYRRKSYSRKTLFYQNNSFLSISLQNNQDYELLKNQKNIRIYHKQNIENTTYYLPRIMKKYQSYDHEILIGELGSLSVYKNFITDFSFNVTNSYTVALLNNLGAKLITLSYENTEENICKIIQEYKKRYHMNPNLEYIISSYPEVMISKFQLLKKHQLNGFSILQNVKTKYKIEENDSLMHIYHSHKVVHPNFQKYYDLGVESLRIEWNDSDDFDLIQKII